MNSPSRFLTLDYYRHRLILFLKDKSRVGPALVKFERDQRRDTLHGGPTYLDILVELKRLENHKDGKRIK